MATAQVVALKPTAKSRRATTTRTRSPSLRERLALGSAASIGGVAVAATTLRSRADEWAVRVNIN